MDDTGSDAGPYPSSLIIPYAELSRHGHEDGDVFWRFLFLWKRGQPMR